MKKDIFTYKSDDIDGFDSSPFLYQFIEGRKLTNIPHRHDFYEIVAVLKGEVTQFIDEHCYNMGECDFVILSPENTHYFLSQSKKIKVFSFSVRKENFLSCLAVTGTEISYAKAYHDIRDDLSESIEKLLHSKNENKTIYLNFLLLNFFEKVFISDTEPKNDNIPDFLLQPIEMIKKNKSFSNGVKNFTSLSGYSHAQLCRLTKKYFGKTPKQILDDIRLEMIKDYLQNTDYTLEILAETFEYSSMSQFHKAVNCFYHTTPGELRRKYRQRTGDNK